MDSFEQDWIIRRLEHVADRLEQARLDAYLRYVRNWKRRLFSEFVSGIVRGIGFSVGFTVLGALLLYVLLCRYVKGCKPKGALQLMIVLIACMLLFYIYRMLLYFPDVEPMTRKDGLLLHWNPDRN